MGYGLYCKNIDDALWIALINGLFSIDSFEAVREKIEDILEENDLVNNSDDKGRIEFFDSSNSEYKRERFFSNLKINVFNSKKCS